MSTGMADAAARAMKDAPPDRRSAEMPLVADARTLRDLRGEVQAFLDRLGRALTAGDGETVATMFEVPALVIRSARVIALSSPPQVARSFGGAPRHYRALGVVATRADLIDLERIDDRLVIASVRWPYLDATGRTVGAETSDYTLRRDDHGQLRIRCVLMRGTEARPA